MLKHQQTGFKYSQRPERWKMGPDPWVRCLWKKYQLARNQARYLKKMAKTDLARNSQSWTLTWHEYQATMDPHKDHGRDPNSPTLCRIDKSKGWHADNVFVKTRSFMHNRPKVKNGNGQVIRRFKRYDEPHGRWTTRYVKGGKINES